MEGILGLVGDICDSPIVLLAEVREDGRWRTPKFGVFPDGIGWDPAFWEEAASVEGLLTVGDTMLDERFAESPQVNGGLGIRFFAARRLLDQTGTIVGVLCVYDRRPRSLTSLQARALSVLGDQVMVHLRLGRCSRTLAERERLLETVGEYAQVGVAELAEDGRCLYANEAFAWFAALASAPDGKSAGGNARPAFCPEQFQPWLERALAGESRSHEFRKRTADEELHYEICYKAATDGAARTAAMVVSDVTPLKQAEKGLHEIIRYSQSTIDALSTGVCVLDLTGTILSTNLTWRRFTAENSGDPSLAGVGINYLQVCELATGCEQSDGAASAAGIRAVLRGETQDFSMEYPCHSPDEQRWFSMRVTRFPGEGPVRVAVAHENITERKLAELASLQYVALVASSNDAIIGTDLDGHITSWNMGAEAIFGYAADEMVGHSMIRFFPPELLEEEQIIMDRAAAGESIERFETRRNTKDGRIIEVSVTTSPIVDTEGNILGISKVARDITERKKTERSLQESNRRYCEMLENMDLIAISLDLEGRITFCNDFLLRLTGWQWEEVAGHCWYETFLPESASGVKDLYLDTIKEGEVPAHLRNPIKTRTGELRTIAWNITILRDLEDGVAGVSAIGEDVTER